MKSYASGASKMLPDDVAGVEILNLRRIETCLGNSERVAQHLLATVRRLVRAAFIDAAAGSASSDWVNARRFSKLVLSFKRAPIKKSHRLVLKAGNGIIHAFAPCRK